VATEAAQQTSSAADGVAAAHAKMLRDTSLQFDWTAFNLPKPRPAPEWLKALAHLFDAAAPLLGWVFKIGVIAALAFLLFFIVRELIWLRWPELKRKRRPKPPVADWRPTEAEARALLEDADRLAAEGRFEEAVHILLFRSIEDIQGRKPHLLKPALTSRDIAGLDGLPKRARDAFGGIADAVERSFFGGRPVDAEGFAECRKAYEAFAFAEAWT
jgi:hypothetical protein